MNTSTLVIESLINPFKAEKKPSFLILLGIFYTTLALFLSLYIFKDQASMVFVFLTVMAAIPLMFGIIKIEEKKDTKKNNKEGNLLKEHSKALKAFMALFLGITIAVIAWYVIVPSTTSSQIFATQINTLGTLGHDVTAAATSSGLASFSNIFFNNLKVLLFCILFSFVYGTGAIFILAWNASVIGVAIGNFIRTELAMITQSLGFEHVAAYFSVVSVGLLKYIIHGIPEIAAYFIAALAGGIISISIIRHDFKGKSFEKILLDAADLLFLAIGLIFVAALLEVWVTPLLFG